MSTSLSTLRSTEWSHQSWFETHRRSSLRFKSSLCTEAFLKWRTSSENKAQDHIILKKREQFHKIGWEIDLEKVELGSVTLFNANGEKLSKFDDITADCKLIIISLDGTFKGISNSLKPEDKVKQRILNEKKTRNSFKEIEQKFAKMVIDSTSGTQQSYYPKPQMLPSTKHNHNYPHENDIYRSKILSKTKYTKGFNPIFFGGLNKGQRNAYEQRDKMKPATLQGFK